MGREDLPALAKARARTVVSVWGRSAGEYGEVGRRLAEALAGAPAEQRSAVVAVEANISCPNIEDRQRMFSHSAEGAAAALGPLIEALKATGLPVWAKLSPNVTDLVAIAGAALASGAGALTLVNTLMGLAVDPATGLPRLGGGGGGLSGPALHAVAVRAVYECRQRLPGGCHRRRRRREQRLRRRRAARCGSRRGPGRHRHLRRPEGTAAGTRRTEGLVFSRRVSRASQRWRVAMRLADAPPRRPPMMRLRLPRTGRTDRTKRRP